MADLKEKLEKKISETAELVKINDKLFVRDNGKVKYVELNEGSEVTFLKMKQARQSYLDRIAELDAELLEFFPDKSWDDEEVLEEEG